jgi:4-hydroxy-tetrahydrodipicolinate reductase
MAIDLIMNGAAGRMGKTILSLAAADPRFAIVAGVDRQAGKLRDLGVPSDAPVVTEMPPRKGAVVIDFSHHSAFAVLTRHCAEQGMGLVSGTTGVEPGEHGRLLDEASRRVPVLSAPNMAVGVNVVFRMAGLLAKALGPDYDIEIVEAHHNQKVDAPSGTALGIADSILAATGRTRKDLVDGRSGNVGARRKGEIGMHALRMGDVVGDHTAYFVGGGERILLGHVAHSREIFARGALRAAAFIGGAKPGRYGMADVLGI